MPEENDCIFCKIAKKEIPANIIYEDEYVLAFLDINPLHDGHTLIIPKKHYSDFCELPKQELHALMEALQKVIKAVRQAVNADGINVGLNIGRAAGQLVFHAHFHVIPRYADDGFTHWKRVSEKKPDFDLTAEKIRQALKE